MASSSGRLFLQDIARVLQGGLLVAGAAAKNRYDDARISHRNDCNDVHDGFQLPQWDSKPCGSISSAFVAACTAAVG